MTAKKKAKNNSGIRILIVEDELGLRDIYATKLAAEGFDVMTASNGSEGLNLAVQYQPHIMLLDIVMPVKDGFQTLQDLKLNPKTSSIPVIILSNLGQGYEVKRGMSLGATSFLNKANFLPVQVVEEINRVLNLPKGGSAAAAGK